MNAQRSTTTDTPSPVSPDPHGLDLLSRLLHRIAPEADVLGADPDAVMQDEFDLDSMDFLNLITALAEETRIVVPDRDYASVSTVRGFADYVATATPAG